MLPLIFVTKPTPAAQEAEAKARHFLQDIELDKPLVIAVGGDGTMLQAVKDYQDQDVVFAGLSAGSLGLLQTINVEHLPQLTEALRNGSYEVIHAPLLSIAYCQPVGANAQDDQATTIIGHAFNDISVERQESRAAKFKLKIDDSAGDFIGDGVIFSTPLGSTAYSLAAGGPIIDSRLQDIFVVTPNNPHLSSLHSSLQRPHVLSKNRHVRIEVAEADKHRPLQVAIDGVVAARDIVSPLTIKVSERTVKILQLGANRLSRQIEEKRLGRA
jgi:NAD+ kinase